MVMISDPVVSSGRRVGDVRSVVEELQYRFGDVPCDELAEIGAGEYDRLCAVATVVTYLRVLTLRAAEERLRFRVAPIRQRSGADATSTEVGVGTSQPRSS